jgi:DNA-binding MarR family transcriptional regulator
MTQPTENRTQKTSLAYRQPNTKPLTDLPEINQSYFVTPTDIFDSGLARTIGMNAFGVWCAIKRHADYNTGECWPGMRRLSELTGLSTSTIQSAVDRLVQAKLLRVTKGGAGSRSNRYVARERLDVHVGARLLCTVVIDYIPAHHRERVAGIAAALRDGTDKEQLSTLCEILPGPGFEWNPSTGALAAVIPASEIRGEFDERLERLRQRAKSVDK